MRGEWRGMKLEKYIGRDRFLYPLALVSCDEDLGFHSVSSHWSGFCFVFVLVFLMIYRLKISPSSQRRMG